MTESRGRGAGPGDRPRALLVQPPVYDFALYDLFLQPFGLLRIGDWLRAAGYDVELLDGLAGGDPRRDAPGRGKLRRVRVPAPAVLRDVPRSYARYGMAPEELEERILRARPDVILATSGMTYWYPGIREIAETCERMVPATPLVVGGVYATLLPEHCRTVAPNAHVVPGEARDALPPLLAELGLPRPTGAPPPNPSYACASSRRFRGSAVIRLNEGCRGGCSYCASRRIVGGFRRGATDALVDSVGRLLEAGVRTFAFYDDALLEDAEEGAIPTLERLIGMWDEGEVELCLPNAVHASKLTPRVASLLRRAGVREVRLGIESVQAAFHRRHDAKLGPGQVEESVKMLRSAGFEPSQIAAYVLAGLPGQQAADVEGSVRSLVGRELTVFISEYSPVPGSPLFSEACTASRYPLEREPLCHNNSIFPLASASFTPDDMQRIKRLACEHRARLCEARSACYH